MWHQQTSLYMACNTCKCTACALYTTCDICQHQICDRCIWQHMASHDVGNQSARSQPTSQPHEGPDQQGAAAHTKRRKVTKENKMDEQQHAKRMDSRSSADAMESRSVPEAQQRERKRQKIEYVPELQ